MTSLCFSSALFLVAGSLLMAAEGPQILSASDPVRPDEAVLLTGEAFGDPCSVELEGSKGWETIEPLQKGPRSLTIVVPKSWPQGAWACRVRRGETVSAPVVLNAPTVWWWNGDGGELASPGGWLRVFGKCLSFGGSRAQLRQGDGKVIIVSAQEQSGYALKFSLPADLAPGDYALAIHNGLGGDEAWHPAGTVVVKAKAAWKTEVFNVKNFGPRPETALLAALGKAKANGGGVVYLPRGHYPVASTLTIPPHTVLKGEAMELVSLYWPDFPDKPPTELIIGADFGLESISLYCQQHLNVVADTAASERLFMHHVRIRANCYFMIEDASKEFRSRRGPASHRECGAAVMLRGRNFEITDCDIYASNYGVHIMKAKNGLIANNQIRYGGRGYSMENTDRLILENNLIEGNNLLAIGNDITTFWTNYCRHIYYARNRVRQMYGADREMMTLDAGSGAYFGKIAAALGTNLTLAADPVFRDYSPKPHTNWEGAAVQIMDGRGAGQYRFVTSHNGREWQVDKPWIVPPDGTSRIAIAPFRGQSLFIGNTFEDGGAFQLYGAASDTIVAENKGSRMDGFLVLGLNPHAWGHQPSWFCQFLDNEILEGNGYGHRSATIGTGGYDESKLFDGPMVRGAIFRRNVCRNNTSIVINGPTDDTLVENCVVNDTDVGIRIRPGTHGTVLRANTFQGVAQPVADK